MHFVIIGAALFALKVTVVTPQPLGAAQAARPPVVISAAQVQELRAEFAQRTSLRPTAADEAALVNDAIEEELLYRAAVERGLDRNDHSVRFRLTEKMRFLSGEEEAGNTDQLYREAIDLGLDRDDPIVRRMMVEKMRLLASTPTDRAPDDSQLRAYFDQHQQSYLQPARVALTHVFVSAQLHGGRAPALANALLERLRTEATPPERGIERGDPFPLGHRFASQSAAELTKMFGAQFAAAVMALPAGSWSGPVGSPYGLHLVWVEAKEVGQLPPFEAVRGQVLERLRAERRQGRMREVIDQLRRTYEVRVESPPPAGKG